MSEWWNTLMTVEKVLYCIAVPSTIVLIVQTIMLLFGAAGHEGFNPSDTSGIDFDTDINGVSGFDGLHGLGAGHDFSGIHDIGAGHDLNGMHDIGAGHGLNGMHDIGVGHDINGIHDVGAGHDINGLHTDVSHHASAADGTNHAQPQDFDTLRIFTIQGMVAFCMMFSWSALAGISHGVQSARAIMIGIVMGFVLMYIVALILKYSKRLSEDGTFYMRDTLGHEAVVYIPIPPQNTGVGKVNISVNNRFAEYNAVTEEKRMIKTGEIVRITDIVNDTVVVELSQ